MGQVQINSSLQISPSSGVGYLNRQSRPTSYTDTMAGTRGPTPGYVQATTSPVLLDFSKLSSYGGYCWMLNTGSYPVELGVLDSTTGKFFPFEVLKPGLPVVRCLSPYYGQEEGTGPGTGTAGGDTFGLALKAVGGSSDCVVEAYDP